MRGIGGGCWWGDEQTGTVFFIDQLLGVAESDISPSGLGLCDLGWVRHFHFPDEIYVFTLNQHDFSTKTSDLAGQEDDLT